MNMLVFFLAKRVRNAVKTMVVDRKNPKSTSSTIFGVETAAKSCELKWCADRVRTDKANLNFSLELYRLIFSPKLNFSPSTKKTTEYSFELFFPLTKLFLTFVVFACFATTRVNMRFRTKNTRDSAQGYIQCMKCIGSPVVRTDGRTEVRTDGRTDGHVTIMSLPKFIGLIGYQISLAMEFR